jgi:arsenite/tail-anchored protein-transporting ATPase
VRTLLVTGPGGAGTSTVAAAAALRAARSGRRTVLLAAGPAAVDGLDGVPGLDVVPVDAAAAWERLWSGSSDAVAGLLPQLTLPPATSVVPLPGTADVALFAALAEAEADLVVVDAGPLASVVTLVGLPAALRWWRDQLLPPGVRALAAVRTAAVSAGAARRGPVDAALAALPVVEGLLTRDRLADPTGTAVCFVAPARRGAADRLRAAATTLGVHGLRPAAVLARVLPAGTGEWWTARAAEQETALAELGALGALHEVAELPGVPEDPAALEALLEGWELPGSGSPAPPAAERRDGVWQLTVPLPFAEKDAVDLTRWADDLVVTAAGARRNLRLDALLRRCEVTGGRLVEPGTAGAALVVTFAPDPRLWPADLLAAEGRTS